MLLKFFKCGIIAEHGGESFDGRAVEVGLRQRFVEQGGDDGLRAGFGAGNGVQGSLTLAGREFGVKREQAGCGIGSTGSGEGFERGVSGERIGIGLGERGEEFGFAAAEVAEGVQQGVTASSRLG